MKTIALGKSEMHASRLAYGCWRIAETEEMGRTVGRAAILAAFDAGYTLFDHADLYCDGRAESAFGAVLRDTPSMRGRIVIATKCGIRKPGEPSADAPFRYDFSAAHIVRSCEESLRRLCVETIDLFQLHRPDWLMNPDEVGAAFAQLREQGKAREFGVSNFRPSQLTALQSGCAFPLVVNQVEISLAARGCFEDGSLDQCLAEKITPLAWSPLAGGLLAEGARRLLDWQKEYRVEKMLAELDAQARALGTTRGNVALAWLLKHPAGIVPIVGSTRPEKIREAVGADEIDLKREEWYRLLEAARGERLP